MKILNRSQVNEHGTQVQGVPGASAWERVWVGLVDPRGRSVGRDRMFSPVELALVGLMAMCVLSAVISTSGSVRVLSWMLAAATGWLLYLSCRKGSRQIAEAQAGLARARSGDLSGLPDELGAWARGALSEESIGRMLAGLGPGYRVEHDLVIAGRGGTVRANVDHLVRTPSGRLVMIDTKRWAGQVELGPGGRLCSAQDRDPRGPRGRALETLWWLCGQVRPRPDLVIIAVDGPGSVAGGRLVVRPGREQRGLPPVVVVHADRLIGELGAADRSGGRR